MMYDDPNNAWEYYPRRQSQMGPLRESPDGGPGGAPPQNQAAMAATQPGYNTNPYPTRPGGPPAAGGISAPPAQGGVGEAAPLSQPYGNAGNMVAQIYRTYLGRDPEPWEFATQFGGGRNMGVDHLFRIQEQLKGTEEAKAFAARSTQTAAPSSTAAPPATGGAGAGGGNYRAQLQNVLNTTPYGYKGLEAAVAALPGWEFQRDSSGMLRGRLKDPSGYMYDIGDPSEGSAGQNWVSGGTQGRYTIVDRGLQPQGQWSAFDGGGGSEHLSALPSLPLATPASVTNRNSYTDALLQYLAQQLGLMGALGGR